MCAFVCFDTKCTTCTIFILIEVIVIIIILSLYLLTGPQVKVLISDVVGKLQQVLQSHAGERLPKYMYVTFLYLEIKYVPRFSPFLYNCN